MLRHQREKGMRFGEAAVALGLASKDDVLFALSQQFHYPYAPEEQRKPQPRTGGAEPALLRCRPKPSAPCAASS